MAFQDQRLYPVSTLLRINLLTKLVLPICISPMVYDGFSSPKPDIIRLTVTNMMGVM